MNSWLAIAAMETRGFLRSKAGIFWTFLYPVLLLALLGAIFTDTDKGYLITGMAALTVISTALFGFTGVLIDLRARGALLPLQLMPISRMQFLTAFAASRIVILLGFSVIFVIIANHVYGAGLSLALLDLGALAGLVLAGSLAFLGLGLVIAAFVSRTATAQALINVANLPIIFLSDLFIPIAIMPLWIQAIAPWSPINSFVDALRRATEPADAQFALPVFAMLCTLAIAGFTLASLRFRWRAQ